MLLAEFFALVCAVAGLTLVAWSLSPRTAPRRSPETWTAPVHPPAESPTQAPAVETPAASAAVPGRAAASAADPPNASSAVVPAAASPAPAPATPSSAASAPVRATATTTRRPAPRARKRAAEPVTWRTLARAPAGFDDGMHAGDTALAWGNYRTAAFCYHDALARAQREREFGRLYFVTEATLRLNALVSLCLAPAHGLRPATTLDRWAALHELAARGFLGDYQPAIVRLGAMLYRARRNRDELGPEGLAAWDILMACHNLPAPALEFLDGQLLDERLWSLRPKLATHPAAAKELWLSMLKFGRTPDLVHTIWEIAGAAEDEEVKAALTAG